MDLYEVIDKSSSWAAISTLRDDLGDGASATNYLLWAASRPAIKALDGKLGEPSSDVLRDLVQDADAAQSMVDQECAKNSACDAMGKYCFKTTVSAARLIFALASFVYK
jgi:hypothetical protein